MKVRSLLILLLVVGALVPIFVINRWLNRLMKPRENAGRLFLFLIANFVLIIVYTMLVVGMVVRVFPIR